MQQGYNRIQKVFDEIYDASPTAKEFVKRAFAQGRPAPVPNTYRPNVSSPLSPTSKPYNQQWPPKQSVTGRYKVTKGLQALPRPKQIPQEERENVSAHELIAQDEPFHALNRSRQSAKSVPATSFFKELLNKKAGKNVQRVDKQRAESGEDDSGQWDSITTHRSKTKDLSDARKRVEVESQNGEEESNRESQHGEPDVGIEEEVNESDASDAGSEVPPKQAMKSPKKMVNEDTQSENEVEEDREVEGNQSSSDGEQVDPEPSEPYRSPANKLTKKLTTTITDPSPRRTRSRGRLPIKRLPSPPANGPSKDPKNKNKVMLLEERPSKEPNTKSKAVVPEERQSVAQPKTTGKLERRTPTSSEEPSPIQLAPWTIRVRKEGRVILEGYRADQPDCIWCTSCIANRVSNRVLKTAGGTCYWLKGKIDYRLSTEAGVTTLLRSRFQNGFPPDWREVIQAAGDRKPQKSEREDSIRRRVATKKRTAPLIVKGTEEDPLELDQLPQTRSGRRVKPPMAWWANQRVLFYPNTEIVEIKPPTPTQLSHSHLSDSIIHFKEDKLARRRQERSELQRSFQKRRKNNSLMSSRDSSVDMSGSQESVDESQSETEPAQPPERTSRTNRHPPTRPVDSEKDQISNQRKQQKNKEASKAGSNRGTFSEGKPDQPVNGRRMLKAVSRMANPKNKLKPLAMVQKKNLMKQHGISQSPHIDISPLIVDGSESAASEEDVLEKVNTPDIPKGMRRVQLPKHKEPSNHSNYEGVLEIDPLCNSFGSTPLSALTMRRRVEGKRRQRPILADINEESDTERTSRTSKQTHSRKGGKKRQEEESDGESKSEKSRETTKQKRVRGELTNKKTVEKSRSKQGKAETVKKYKNQREESEEESSEEELEEDWVAAKTAGKNAARKPNAKPGGKSSKGKQTKASQEPRKKSTKKQSGTKKSEVESDAQTVESDEEVKGPVAKTVKGKDKSGKDKNENLSDMEEDQWTKAEIADYKKALRELNPAMDHFWHNVAVRVGLKSAEQCQAYHQRTAADPPQKKKKPPPKADKAPRPLGLTGGVGTLKRKRELCQMLDAFNDNHEDDFFDATPVRQAKRFKMPMLDEDEDAFFQDRPNTETPLTYRYRTPNARLAWMPTADKTPVTSLLSPGLTNTVDRKNQDVYAHRLAKERAGPRIRVSNDSHAQHQKQEKPKKSDRSELYQNLFTRTNPHQDELDHDSEVEEDYYFSDEDSS